MARRRKVWLMDEEIDVIMHCIDYAWEHDDEGIRCSDPEAVRRTFLLGSLDLKERIMMECGSPSGQCINHGACNAADRCMYGGEERG